MEDDQATKTCSGHLYRCDSNDSCIDVLAISKEENKVDYLLLAYHRNGSFHVNITCQGQEIQRETINDHSCTNHTISAASNDSGRVFGCYIFGRGGINTYATPISFGNTSNTFNFRLTDSLTTTTPWCTPSPQNIRDGLDNDCDGYIDEEVSNEKDEDYDGRIDEDNSKTTKIGYY
nr:hypothetical protein BgiMline_014667 [Biomphalaria glabrata]